MNEVDEMVIEKPPHLQDNEEDNSSSSSTGLTKKVVSLADDDNDFDSMNIRPESLFLRGVDDLSPRNIKLYIDRYIKPDYSFATKDKYESLNYKIEWINDSSLNVVFQDAENALIALKGLSSVALDQIPNTEERKANEYVNEDGEDKLVDLYIRQSFSYDKKIKNARVYSRYYLLHGEPEKNDRPKKDYYSDFKKDKYRERETYARDEEPDLITGEVRATSKSDDDLIPDHRSLKDRIGIPNRGEQRRRRGRARAYNDEEEDLFPGFASSKRDRSRSPTRRMEDIMDVDDGNNNLENRVQPKGRSMEDLLGL